MIDISSMKPEHLWYFVGLIATDGNLSGDGRHITLTSKDREHLLELKQILGMKCKLGKKGSGSMPIKNYSVLQFGDVNFYRFLLSIGLTPCKSITLGPLKIPSEHFTHFVRGVIDGDGHITTWIHSSNQNRQWALGIASAAIKFISWLKSAMEEVYGVKGRLHVSLAAERNPIYRLKFGKLAAKPILARTYKPEYFGLQRKMARAMECLQDENRMINYGSVIARVA